MLMMASCKKLGHSGQCPAADCRPVHWVSDMAVDLTQKAGDAESAQRLAGGSEEGLWGIGQQVVSAHDDIPAPGPAETEPDKGLSCIKHEQWAAEIWLICLLVVWQWVEIRANGGWEIFRIHIIWSCNCWPGITEFNTFILACTSATQHSKLNCC